MISRVLLMINVFLCDIGCVQDLVERSYVVRDEQKERGWKEMYDPVTFGFWYYNEFSKRNSWEAPLIFQKTFGKILCSTPI